MRLTTIIAAVVVGALTLSAWTTPTANAVAPTRPAPEP